MYLAICTRSSVCVLVLVFFLFQEIVIANLTPRPVDYVAPVNPCRLEDRFCSVKCQMWQMKGDVTCDFCYCKNKDDIVKWTTLAASTLSKYPTSTLPPDVIIVNNIRYHRVGDPCQMSRDRMCPSQCAEIQSAKPDGRACTICDCQGAAVILGGRVIDRSI